MGKVRAPPRAATDAWSLDRLRTVVRVCGSRSALSVLDEGGRGGLLDGGTPALVRVYADGVEGGHRDCRDRGRPT